MTEICFLTAERRVGVQREWDKTNGVTCNWNSEGQGNFTNDGTQNTPGLANDGTDDDNYSLEVITYLDLPAGVITMGVNSDDGFRVTTFSGDPRGPSAVTLGQFDGGRSVADTRFQFVVERAGVYPFRLIYQEGTGGSAVEWFAVRTDNTLHLLNDENDTVSIRAYRPVAPPVTAVGRFSSAKLSGNNIVIEWAGGGTLQSADDITGPWSDVAGATSPRTVPPSGTRKFYRLKQ